MISRGDIYALMAFISACIFGALAWIAFGLLVGCIVFLVVFAFAFFALVVICGSRR